MSGRRHSGVARFIATLAVLVWVTGNTADQLTMRLPTFPQKFDVQGPETEAFVFAVTQPGPVAVDVQSSGAPIEVTLIGSASAPVKQRGSGQVRLGAQATPEDVQRSPFWRVQVRAWCEEDCLTRRPRSGGLVTVRHPPIDQSAVQRALQALSAQQQQPPPPDSAQAAALSAQMEQAFQQRRAQFEQQQEHRRAALFAQIQPQVAQLQARVDQARADQARVDMGAAIRSRGLEETPERKEEVATRATPPMGLPAGRFPQKFDVHGPESDSFGFAVTQPGAIQVDVQAQGAPVVVTLQHLASPPLSRQGSGQISFAHQVTPQDIQKSALWAVKVRLVEPGARTSGTVTVRHPPADPAVVQAQTVAVAHEDAANRERTAAQADAESRAEFQQFKARFEEQQRQRQTAERAQNRQIIDRLRANPGGMIRSRAIAPVIERLNKSQGQPKDQLIVYGRNFGPGGEVVFQLGPNIRGTGIVEAWSDTVVVVAVPDASGLLQHDGSVAIFSGQVQSNTAPFRFVPALEVREVRTTRGDLSIAQPGTVSGSTVERIEHPNTTFGQLGGSKGNDIFFPSRQLGNGWLVQSITLKVDPCAYPNCRGAYVADSRIGTASPYFNVRWWYEALVASRYSFSLYIVGPRGTPDGIATTGPLQPVVPPGTAATPVPGSAPPAERTPPPQPPVKQSESEQPLTMTVVPLNPALIPGYTVAPSSQPPASQQPPADQQPPTMTIVPINPALLIQQVQPAPGSGTSTPPPAGTSPSTGSSAPSPPPAAPVITSLSVAGGRPGDPVMISGTNFGGARGQIRFVIANGKDVVAPAGAIWSDTQIFTSVPAASGLLAFNGTVYIKRAADMKASNLAAFRFEPTLELRELSATMDRLIQEPYSRGVYDTTASQIMHSRNPDLFGAKGNDELFRTGKLKNGWIVDDVFVTPWYVFGSGSAYVADSRRGTDLPYLNVRWWVDPFSVVGYRFGVRIIGPKGVPDGIAVP